MKDINSKIYNIRRLDEIGERNTPIHKINASVKIIITFMYIFKVISIDTINLKDMLVVLAYPLIIFVVGKVEFIVVAKKIIIAIPLIFGIIIANIIMDPTIYQIIKSILLILKTVLTVFGGVLLLASTGMNNIVVGLRKLKVPNIFIMQLSMIYRYIIVMLEEASKIKNAYALRSGSNKGVNLIDFGSIIGQMLLRSIDKGENVYNAMKLRGYDGEFNINDINKIKCIDIFYLLFWITIFYII